jgi:uncharacterized membrane protein YraQ (UPF0718 family)
VAYRTALVMLTSLCDEPKRDGMDVTVSTAASQKAIDTLKATPLWLFAGVALSCFVVWVAPPFRSALPETVQAWLPVAFAASLILALCKATSVLVFHRVARQKASIERSRQKLIPRVAVLHAPRDYCPQSGKCMA